MSESQALKVERGLLSIAYGNLTPMLLMSVGASLAVSLILDAAGTSWIWMWFVAVTVLSVVRFIASRSVTRAKIEASDSARIARYRLQYAIGLYASAVLWLTPACLVDHESQAARYTLAIMMSALAAGGSGIMASLLKEGRVYIALMLGPTSIVLFRGTESAAVMMLLGVAFIVMMFMVHKRNHGMARRALLLSAENAMLVEELRSVNQGLETTVAARTKQLAEAAYRDDLTGLPNRRGLMEWMQRHLDAEGKDEASALFLDLDRFKQINDAMGHAVGDRVLLEVAARMQACLPRGGILARWGGDEFVLVLPQHADARSTTNAVAARIIDRVSRPLAIDDHAIDIGISIGASFFPTDAQEPRSLILAADLAMAEVKRSGRGQVRDYCETFGLVQKRRFDLGRALGTAIKEGQLYLQYQPIVNAQTAQVHSYEALARWQHSAMGQIGPDEFISLAESTDRIRALGELIMTKACVEAARWNLGNHAPKVAVNVSVMQLRDEAFAMNVMRILRLANLPPARLELEVTESLFENEHLETVQRTIANLRELGVSISIDDFGTGYSSLSRLQSLAVSAVKIDQSFVADLDNNGRTVVESIILIARRLKLETIAEGIETEAQFETLRSLGVDYLQGYYFGKPTRRVADTSTANHLPPPAMENPMAIRAGS